MDADLSLSMIRATVQIDQPSSAGKQVVGTGFLVSLPRGDQPPEIVLVTAGHVLDLMKSEKMRIGWRVETAQGWTYRPSQVTIRNADGPVYVSHPSQDIAVIPVDIPPSLTASVIPVSALADDKTFDALGVDAGEEMATLGYPYGLSSNNEGFPILRTGRVASYPLGPTRSFPTFLIDLTAISGNSGGPVFLSQRQGNPGDPVALPVITGVLTRQVEQDGQRLELGLVTHAVFVRQTLDLLLKKEAVLKAQGTMTSSSSAAPMPPKARATAVTSVPSGRSAPKPVTPATSAPKPQG
jgi:S1-C subfamily serine protease